MKLFGHQDSGHAYKVKLALDIADIAHHYQWVDIFAPRESRDDDFMANARFHEVPLLLDDGRPYVQSNAILVYIAEKYRLLGGEDVETLQRCKEWLFWEANKIGMCLPQIRSARKFKDPGIQGETLDWLMARYHHDVNIIEQALFDGRAFLTGDNVSIADCSCCGYLFFAEEAEVQLPPLVTEWLERIASLEGWAHPYTLLEKT